MQCLTREAGTSQLDFATANSGSMLGRVIYKTRIKKSKGERFELL